MSKRQEDFDTQSDKYIKMRKSFGVNDPYAIKEIREAHYQGAEYGSQYTIKKICGWLLKHAKEYICVICDGSVTSVTYEDKNLIDDLRKTMEE